MAISRYVLGTALVAATVLVSIAPISTNATSMTAFYADRHLALLPVVDAPAFENYDRLFDVNVGQVSRQLPELQQERPADRAPKSVADLARPAYHLRL
jgi:hypothetical protein